MPNNPTVVQSSTAKRLRIGFWCVHRSKTVDPDEPAGQLAYGLVRALAQLNEPLELVLLTQSGISPRITVPQGASSVAVQVIARTAQLSPWACWLSRFCQRWVEGSNTLRDGQAALRSWLGRVAPAVEDKARPSSSAYQANHPHLGWGTRTYVTLLAVGLFLLLCIGTGVWRFLASMVWGLLFPVWMLDRIVRRLSQRFQTLEDAPVNAAACDVWLVPYPHIGLPRPLGGPAVIMLPDLRYVTAKHVQEDYTAHVLWVTLAEEAQVRQRLTSLGIAPEKLRAAPPLDTTATPDAAQAWLDILRQAQEVQPVPRGLDPKPFGLWPSLAEPLIAGAEPLEAFIFLQIPWGGGNWEHTRDLVQALAAISRQRHRLRLTVGLHQWQPGAWALERWTDVLPMRRIRFNAIDRNEVIRLCPEDPKWLAGRPETQFAFLSGATEVALRADAWLALTDRFPLPLLPLRPYGVVIHDMIHIHVPEALDATFFTNLARGMTPTVQHADRIIVTSPSTRDDVLAYYGLAPERVELIPVASEPHRRFEPLPVGYAPLPRQPFILNVTNASPHKGAAVLLRAYAQLKERLGAATPLLVVCGINTEFFSPSYPGPVHPYWACIRHLLAELGLKEDQDVTFLGTVTDVELKDLYQRAAVVVNAAKHDNGTYCLIEAAYFGLPVVSSRYPAAEFLCERFGIPARFFPVDDTAALAASLAEALLEGSKYRAGRDRMRRHLTAPEFSVCQYAERLYEVLVEMAERGRRQRLLRNNGSALSTPCPSAAA